MLDWIAPQKIFPTILILLDFGGGAVYACYADWRRAIYWLAAAILTICVTY